MKSKITAPAPQAGQSDGQRGTSHVGSGDLVGLGYRGSDGAMTCALCDCEMDWEDCSFCGGDGFFDDEEEGDPTCPQCAGTGGDYWCPTDDCKTMVCTKIVKPNSVIRPNSNKGGYGVSRGLRSL